MINLNIDPYCKNCPHFEVECTTYKTTTQIVHEVKCVNKYKCYEIARHLEKRLKEEKSGQEGVEV